MGNDGEGREEWKVRTWRDLIETLMNARKIAERQPPHAIQRVDQGSVLIICQLCDQPPKQCGGDEEDHQWMDCAPDRTDSGQLQLEPVACRLPRLVLMALVYLVPAVVEDAGQAGLRAAKLLRTQAAW